MILSEKFQRQSLKKSGYFKSCDYRSPQHSVNKFKKPNENSYEVGCQENNKNLNKIRISISFD